MDKEQAKFILQSFRPDGADVHDQDFTDALMLAAENRELGEWLAQERAMDAAFANALASIELPDSLRADILGCLNGEREDFPEVTESHESALIGALASVTPPPSLRGDILAAMEASAPSAKTQQAENIVPFWKSYKVPLAAVAGIALAFILTRPSTPDALVKNDRIAPNVVQAGFIQTYTSPSFQLDLMQESREALVNNLKERSLPCPCKLPPGLENVIGIGCREMIINGKRGSLVCFRKDGSGMVHLVIFRREDIDGQFPTIKEPKLDTNGKWSIAQWQNTENVFMLIGDTKVDQMAEWF